MIHPKSPNVDIFSEKYNDQGLSLFRKDFQCLLLGHMDQYNWRVNAVDVENCGCVPCHGCPRVSCPGFSSFLHRISRAALCDSSSTYQDKSLQC